LKNETKKTVNAAYLKTKDKVKTSSNGRTKRKAKQAAALK